MPSIRSQFAGALRLAVDSALDHLDSLDERPVAATAGLKELRDRLGSPLLSQGLAADAVIRELIANTKDALHGTAGGRFFGWVIGGAHPAALAADWLTSAWDQNCVFFASGPAAAVVEEVAGGWLKQLLGLPETASFAFVTGCTMAHVTCLAAARNGLLAERDWDVERDGLPGSPRIRILTGSERHSSFEKAVRLIGLGTSSIELLPVDGSSRLDPDALRESLARDPNRPTIVMLQAGELNTGAFDDFATLIPIAKATGAWVHIDGAFGLWAGASPQYSHFVKGVSEADSWATDGHKWLNVPYDCGYAFVRDAEAHRRAMSLRASYFVHSEEARDPIDWTPEASRRARGFATYAALRQLGRDGVAELVDRCCAMAHRIVMGIGALPGAEVLWEPRINQGLVRFPAETASASDQRTDAVIARIQAQGGAFFGGATWRGMRVMRVSVSNWQTAEEHADRAIAAVARALSDTDLRGAI